MKNAFSRMGRTCASMAIGGGLVAAGLFASPVSTVNVTLPHAVTVGGNTLPSGDYTITSLDVASSHEFFVIRSANTAPITMEAQKVVSGDDASRTEVIFTKEGDVWHFDKLTIQGEGSSYQFVNGK